MDRLSALFLLAIASVLAGCSKPEQTVEVSGKVTLDEKPLAEGEIYFVTAGLPPEIMAVKEGNFAGKAQAGQRRVEVYAYRQAQLPPTATVQPTTPARENFVPERYNSASVLKEEVKKTGPNQFQFDLKSK
jgi:hypothetical protein